MENAQGVGSFPSEVELEEGSEIHFPLPFVFLFFFFLNDVGSHVWVTLKFSINIPSVGGLHGLDIEVAQGGV